MSFLVSQMLHALFDTYLYCPFSCIILCKQLCSGTFMELSLLLAMLFCLKCCATRLNPNFCCLQAAPLSFSLTLSLCLTCWKSFVAFGEGNRGTAECEKKCGRFWMPNRAKKFEQIDLFCCVLLIWSCVKFSLPYPASSCMWKKLHNCFFRHSRQLLFLIWRFSKHKM